MNSAQAARVARLLVTLLFPLGVHAAAAETAAPLVVGDTFTIYSKILGETRRINVYRPPGYAESDSVRVPVLYMPDGGLAEDFLHVAGLVEAQVEYAAWLESLPDNLRDSPLAEALQAICDLDLTELQAIEPPRGFGRD